MRAVLSCHLHRNPCCLRKYTSAYEVPDTYIKSNRHEAVADTNIPTCQNPAAINGNEVGCESFATSRTLGEVIRGWSAVNQFGLLYLELIPADLTTVHSTLALTSLQSKLHSRTLLY